MSQSAHARRGRLAPSPTGVLHLGNARSFVLAWLDARATDGELCLRIEDIDSPRIRAGALDQTLADLRWLGLDWDGEPFVQSQARATHQASLGQLVDAGLAYPCVCTRSDIATAASAPHAGDEGPIYPGTCRGRFDSFEQAQGASDTGVAWRFHVQSDSRVHWHDLFAGEQEFDVARQLGDFVIWKKDDGPAYQLAVVVDDLAQRVRQVIRGDDLLSSAARQMLLYRALNSPVPEWGHVPLVVGPDGRRLAKRHGDTSLRHLRDRGVSALQVLNWIASVTGLDQNTGLASAATASQWCQLAAASYRRGQVPAGQVVWHGSEFGAGI